MNAEYDPSIEYCPYCVNAGVLTPSGSGDPIKLEGAKLAPLCECCEKEIGRALRESLATIDQDDA